MPTFPFPTGQSSCRSAGAVRPAKPCGLPFLALASTLPCPCPSLAAHAGQYKYLLGMHTAWTRPATALLHSATCPPIELIPPHHLQVKYLLGLQIPRAGQLHRELRIIWDHLGEARWGGLWLCWVGGAACCLLTWRISSSSMAGLAAAAALPALTHPPPP